MLPAVIKKLQDKIEENQRNGGPAKNFSQPLYGHVLTVGMTGRGENGKCSYQLTVKRDKPENWKI